MTFTQRLQVFTPILCRLLARHKGGRPLTHIEIAEHSGKMPDVCNLLSTMEVIEISRQTSWKGIGVLECLAFQRGCGLSLDGSMRRVNDYLSRKPNFEYLRQSQEWEAYYKPLLLRWRNAYPYNVGPSDMPHPSIRRVLNRLTPLHHSHTNVTKP